MLNTPYLMQQVFNLKDSIRYSIGLVVVCTIVLLLLWLPDILKDR